MRAGLWVLTLFVLALPANMTLLGAAKHAEVDEYAVNAAHFAVTQLNAKNDVQDTPLTYEKIISLQKQVVAGIKYIITVGAVTSSGEKVNYTVEVWEKPSNPASNELPMQLTSYKLADV
jgi:hypothetical protein